MTRSNSFNKRELEKKKEQKRQEKQKRKEDRKASNSTGSFWNMIAYVDENGVITSTPPNPDNKQEVDAGNIAVSTPKKEETEETLMKGRVEHFNQGKGYGFIKNIGGTEKYFFHISNVSGQINEGDIVSFQLERGQKGMNAVRITRAD
ncbi:MAG: cold-shock protein [Mangrovibacterium sp.]